MRTLTIILTIILILAAVSAVFFFKGILIPHKPEVGIVWEEDFGGKAGKGAPEGWKLKGKLGTPNAVFSVEENPENGDNFLHVEADKASAFVITKAEGVDLEKTPTLRWRWKVDKLPLGADGRVAAKDDQAIAIYVGSGGMLSNNSVSYRWDTDTPRGAEGKVTYGGGMAKIKWYTLRNKEDSAGKWIVEQRNVAEDFKKAWGYYPKEVYVSVLSNSQYTGTDASADLDWIEFVSPQAGKTEETAIVN